MAQAERASRRMAEQDAATEQDREKSLSDELLQVQHQVLEAAARSPALSVEASVLWNDIPRQEKMKSWIMDPSKLTRVGGSNSIEDFVGSSQSRPCPIVEMDDLRLGTTYCRPSATAIRICCS
eukprot:SAG31_NODE_1179_length_9530_cov_8.153748_7_plen_123_part_00